MMWVSGENGRPGKSFYTVSRSRRTCRKREKHVDPACDTGHNTPCNYWDCISQGDQITFGIMAAALLCNVKRKRETLSFIYLSICN